MVRILLSLLSTHEGSSSRAMMTVGNIEGRHLGKFLCYCCDILIVAYYPQSVTEAVDRSHEVIFWFSSSIAHYQLVEDVIVRISEEHRFDICIVHTNVLHSVFFLVAAGQFVLLDDALLIVT